MLDHILNGSSGCNGTPQGNRDELLGRIQHGLSHLTNLLQKNTRAELLDVLTGQLWLRASQLDTFALRIFLLDKIHLPSGRFIWIVLMPFKDGEIHRINNLLSYFQLGEDVICQVEGDLIDGESPTDSGVVVNVQTPANWPAQGCQKNYLIHQHL